MATYSVARMAHKTLSSTTVDTVNLSVNAARVNVMNRAGTSALYVSWAFGTAATPSAGADDVLIVPAGMALTFAPDGARTAALQLKVLGSGNDYSVQVTA